MPKITTVPGDEKYELQVFVDNELLPETASINFIRIEKSSSFELLGRCKLEAVFEVFEYFQISGSELGYLKEKSNMFEYFDIEILSISRTGKDLESDCIVACMILMNLFDWKSVWSIKEFVKLFSKTYLGMQLPLPFSTFYKEYPSDDFINEIGEEGEKRFYFETFLNHEAYSFTLKEVLDAFVDFLTEVNNLTLRKLQERADAFTLVEYFDFPEEVKTACSQYLQYFYEFLKDIGIKAKVDLTEQDSGKVLFSVTPENKNEALENIRLALDIW